MMKRGGGSRNLSLFLERVDISIFSDSERRNLLNFVLDFAEKSVEKKRQLDDQARYSRLLFLI